MEANRKQDNPLPKRKHLRLPEYDYAQEGAYFVTVCTQDKKCLFGDVVDTAMVLNDAGEMVKSVWDAIPEQYPGIETDEFVVMPNHFHGIIIIADSSVGATPRGCPDIMTPHDEERQRLRQAPEDGQARGPAPTRNHEHGLSLPDVVHRFKTLTTNGYIRGVKQHDWKPFNGKLWQRNYFERVIRNERELHEMRTYITNNPLKWALDHENPDCTQNPKHTP